MARKSLVVHIGGNKTGSSAIQNFLALNSGVLRGRGIVVPDQDLQLARSPSGFHVFAFERLFRDPQGREAFSVAIRQIFESADDANTVLLSAENLVANAAAPALFSGLADEYDIRIILYVRRQDDYLLSSWQQWYSKVSGDLWAWLTGVVGLMGNWRMYLERWEAVVPRERITVRVYQRDRLDGGDAILDFYNRLGLDMPFESLRYPERQVNPSYSDAIVELVKGNKSIFNDAHDNGFYSFVQSVTGGKHVRDPRRSIITFPQRLAILQRYADANQWVRDKYFPDSPGPLFAVPKPEDYEYMTQDAMRAEQMEFLAAALYAMHKGKTS